MDIEKILQQMTLEEKADFCSGSDFWHTQPVERLGVPAVMLREEKDTFLDDMTIEQLGQRLGVKVEVLPTGGGDEAKALLRSGLHIARRRRP